MKLINALLALCFLFSTAASTTLLEASTSSELEGGTTTRGSNIEKQDHSRNAPENENGEAVQAYIDDEGDTELMRYVGILTLLRQQSQCLDEFMASKDC